MKTYKLSAAPNAESFDLMCRRTEGWDGQQEHQQAKALAQSLWKNVAGHSVKWLLAELLRLEANHADTIGEVDEATVWRNAYFLAVGERDSALAETLTLAAMLEENHCLRSELGESYRPVYYFAHKGREVGEVGTLEYASTALDAVSESRNDYTGGHIEKYVDGIGWTLADDEVA